MDNTCQPSENCRSIFKNGEVPTAEAYTKVWIDLINALEKRKALECGGYREMEE